MLFVYTPTSKPSDETVVKNPEEKLCNVFVQSKKSLYVIVTRINFPSYGKLCSMTSTFPFPVLPPMHFHAFV